MLNEDHVCQIVYKTQTIESLRAIILGHEETIEELTTIRDNQKQEIEDFTNQVKELKAGLKTQLTDLEKQKEDNDKLTLEFEDYKLETEDQIAELKA